MNHFLGQFCKDSPQWHSSYSKILLNNLFEVFFVGLVNDDIHNILVLYHVGHKLSSSYNPQSNGHMEQAVKTVKSLLKKTDTFDQFKVALT